MIGALQARGQGDLLALGYAFASLVYDAKADKQWLRRRFAMFESTLEDSWFYMASSLLEKTVNDLLAAQTIEQARLILTEAINKPS